MRKILFRGKTLEERGMLAAGSWITGGYYVDYCYGGCPEGKHYIVTWNSGYGGFTDLIPVDPKTIGQLVDRGIFEGDIVKYTSRERTGTRVSYKRRGYDTFSVDSDVEIIGHVIKGERDSLLTYIVDTKQFTTYPSYFWGEGKRSDRPKETRNSLVKPFKTTIEYEVIGNIHDNPELLESVQ